MAAATEEQKAVLKVLQLLREEWEDWYRHRLPQAATTTVKVAEGKFTALAAQELDNHMLYRGTVGQFEENQVIYIKPPTKDGSSVAGVWCRWNYDKSPPSCGFYFGLWSSQSSFPKANHPSNTKHTAFVGYRFETPEQGDNHNFYHAQPCRSMGIKDDELEHALPISQRDPTWPLAAANALELLLCLITSLYGMKGLTSIQDTILGDVGTRSNTLITGAFKKMLALQRSEN